MQGQRSVIDSLPENLSFDEGSTSSNAGLDQSICWNDMRNSAHNRVSDYVIPPCDPSITFLSSTSQDGRDLSGWNLGETSSRNEQKTEYGWSSSTSAFTGPGPDFGEQRYVSPNVLSLNNVNANLNSNEASNGPWLLQSSSTHAIPQDLNMNPEGQVTGLPDIYKSNGTENGWISSTSSFSDPFRTPPRSGGYLMEENNDRPGCSLEGRRMSGKRKALEGNVGQSSISGSSSYSQHAESSVWHAISTPPEHPLGVSSQQAVNPRLGLGVGGAPSEALLALNATQSAESSRRNFRVRVNPSRQETSLSNNVFSTSSNFSAPHDSSRFLPHNNSLESRSARSADTTNLQRQSVVAHVHALRQNLQSSRWNGGSSSRPGNSSGSIVSGEVNTPSHVESNSTNVPINISGRPIFVPTTESRNSVQNPTNQGLIGGNTSIPGNVASIARSAPNLALHGNPPRYPRRLSEFVRRSLMLSAGSEFGGQRSNNSLLSAGSSTSLQETALSSGAGNQGHNLLHLRSAMLSDRLLDGAFGTPNSLRSLAAASEGRSRLVSEIRNVLDLMRRGEALRAEDLMILDQSVLFGMTDIHDRRDRHRDMRLDVDNMSYEELLALEDRIGYVSTGLSEETIVNCLKQRKYLSIAIGAREETEPCCICQEAYNDGEDLGMLECGHDFHSVCIKQWLTHKNLCPICKTTALVT